MRHKTIGQAYYTVMLDEMGEESKQRRVKWAGVTSPGTCVKACLMRGLRASTVVERVDTKTTAGCHRRRRTTRRRQENASSYALHSKGRHRALYNISLDLYDVVCAARLM